MEKKTFIEPEVTKVEFEFNEVIAASDACLYGPMYVTLIQDPQCA